MKHLLLTTIAAVVLVGCGESQLPEPPTAKAPDISIHEAAIDGNIEAVKQHLAAGTNVNAKSRNGETPLLLAAYRDHKEIVELLIAKGADVNVKDKVGWTPLHSAVGQGHKEIAELLIAKGADMEAKDVGGLTPLHFSETKEIGELLIANGANVNSKSNKGWTPLYSVALGHWMPSKNTGFKEVAELLIANGADVNAKNDRNRTPLHNATLNGRKEIVELLIVAGADVNAKANNGTPLDVAIKQKRTEIADLLRKHGGTGEELKAAEPVAEASTSEPPTATAPDISLFDAAMFGNIEAVKQHLAAGTDVDAVDAESRDKYRWTPLHIAAAGGREEIAKLLIVAGADVNAKGAVGETPLDFAIKGKHPETADLLRKHGGKTGEELKAEGK